MALGDIPISLIKQTIDNKSGLMSFINELEGYKTRFKNLHWSAQNDAIHVRIDELSSELASFQDEVAEVIQGVYGQFGPNVLSGTPVSQPNPIDALKDLQISVANFHKSIIDKPELIGLVASVESFMTVLNKYTYLFKISLH